MLSRRHALALLAAAPLAPALAVPPAGHKVRGMTVSCPTDGSEWGTDVIEPTLDRLKANGCNWIAIHPYAGIRRDGTVYEWGRLRFDAPPAWITRPIRAAHRRGMKIMVKPHLGYWGSGFSWRGAIAFDAPAAWRRFFATYTRWIERVAEASAGADAFVVGTELDKTLAREADWRLVVAAVRARHDGPLTYAANWSDFRRVPFWDALDVIGVQAYFPLVDEGAPPTAERLRAGWSRWMGDIGTYARAQGRYVVFTELGYNLSARAAIQPWAYETGGPGAAAVQSRALDAALHALAVDPRVVGAFLWKCFPGRRRPRDFDMTAPHVQRIIRRYWS